MLDHRRRRRCRRRRRASSHLDTKAGNEPGDRVEFFSFRNSLENVRQRQSDAVQAAEPFGVQLGVPIGGKCDALSAPHTELAQTFLRTQNI